MTDRLELLAKECRLMFKLRREQENEMQWECPCEMQRSRAAYSHVPIALSRNGLQQTRRFQPKRARKPVYFLTVKHKKPFLQKGPYSSLSAGSHNSHRQVKAEFLSKLERIGSFVPKSFIPLRERETRALTQQLP